MGLTWKNYKNLGPWPFMPQPDKPHYNEGNLISDHDNPVWKTDFLNTPVSSDDRITYAHHPWCGYWTKDYTPPVPLPIPFDAGRWVAAQERLSTPYIYLYDITKKAVIKLETLEVVHTRIDSYVVVRETLSIDALYPLDHNASNIQRGGYCMDKDGSTLWYLFRSPDTGNCELVEVDISLDMRVVKRTSFSGLLSGYGITDGCSDGIHTYWSTNLSSGRIIKIRNSDHVIIDDHLFNFSLDAGATYAESIVSLDTDGSSIYWIYVLNHADADPRYDACAHYAKSDMDLNIELEHVVCGSGFSTPQWFTLLRIYDNYVLAHRSYHPFWGYMLKRTSASFALVSYQVYNYLKNILGVASNKLFVLQQNDTATVRTLSCTDFTSFSKLATLDVSTETGVSFVSALCPQTKTVVLVRYDSDNEINILSCFKADDTLEKLSEIGLDHIEVD